MSSNNKNITKSLDIKNFNNLRRNSLFKSNHRIFKIKNNKSNKNKNTINNKNILRAFKQRYF